VDVFWFEGSGMAITSLAAVCDIGVSRMLIGARTMCNAQSRGTTTGLASSVNLQPVDGLAVVLRRTRQEDAVKKAVFTLVGVIVLGLLAACVPANTPTAAAQTCNCPAAAPNVYFVSSSTAVTVGQSMQPVISVDIPTSGSYLVTATVGLAFGTALCQLADADGVITSTTTNATAVQATAQIPANDLVSLQCAGINGVSPEIGPTTLSLLQVTPQGLAAQVRRGI
jgi:hypothetical protein